MGLCSPVYSANRPSANVSLMPNAHLLSVLNVAGKTMTASAGGKRSGSSGCLYALRESAPPHSNIPLIIEVVLNLEVYVHHSSGTTSRTATSMDEGLEQREGNCAKSLETKRQADGAKSSIASLFLTCRMYA